MVCAARVRVKMTVCYKGELFAKSVHSGKSCGGTENVPSRNDSTSGVCAFKFHAVELKRTK